ncbi:hypothetical protein Hte_002280 [Hypoxylon texense]
MGVKGKQAPTPWAPAGRYDSLRCQPSDKPVRRHTAGGDQESGERIAQLESKLECLVSQLQSRQVLGDGDGGDGNRGTNANDEAREPPPEQPGASSFATPTLPFLRSNTLLEDADDANANSPMDLLTEATGPGPGPGFAKPPVTTTALLHTGPVPTAPVAATSEPLDDNDPLFATCLDTFISSMLPYFPILHFSPGVTVERLRRDRPLLLRAIVSVAWPFPREKRARALDLKRTLLEAYFLRHEGQRWDRSGEEEEETDPSIDLLLALLIYISWGWDHAHNGGGLSYLMMPCVSLVGEMFLDRPAPRGLHTANIFAPQSGGRHDADQLSPERRRAVLGCFVLSTVVSSFFADMDAMNWTPQMEKVLAAMNTSQECPGDAGLVLQVRLQLLCLKSAKMRSRLQAQHSQADPAVSAASITIDSEVLLEQLEELRTSTQTLSEFHPQIYLAHMSYVEIQILETIRASSLTSSQLGEADTFAADPRSNGNDSSGDPGQNISSTGYGDLQYIWQSMLALGACTSTLLDIPPSRFPATSFVQWEQLVGCLVVLSDLDNIQDGRINPASARAVVDLPVLLDRVVEKLTLAAAEALEEEHGGTFALLASRVRAFRSSVRGSVVEADRPGPDHVSGSGNSKAVPFRPSQGPFQNPKIWIDQLFAA